MLSVKLVMINSYNLLNIYSLLTKLDLCGKVYPPLFITLVQSPLLEITFHRITQLQIYVDVHMNKRKIFVAQGTLKRQILYVFDPLDRPS